MDQMTGTDNFGASKTVNEEPPSEAPEPPADEPTPDGDDGTNEEAENTGEEPGVPA